MFDVGFWELILIFGVGLMILGPERMPRVAAQIGRWIGRARRTASQLRRQLQRELELDDLMNPRPPPWKPPPTAPKSPAADQDAEKPSTDDADGVIGVEGVREDVESIAGSPPRVASEASTEEAIETLLGEEPQDASHAPGEPPTDPTGPEPASEKS